MGWLTILMVIILQWNARSLLANGQEFKHFLNELNEKPDVICIQESWLKPHLDFVIHGYTIIRRDRNSGEGCVLYLLRRVYHIDYWAKGMIKSI